MSGSSSTTSATEHLEGAPTNRSFALDLRKNALDTPTNVRWAVTALFYSALHALSAYVGAQYKIRAGGHADRLDWLRKYPERLEWGATYDGLQQQSHPARYDLAHFTWTDFDAFHKRAEPMIRDLMQRASNAGA